MSIYSEYANKILSGEKRYEYRRQFKDRGIKYVVIYSARTVQRVVGFFELRGIIRGDVEKVWDWTKDVSGLDKEAYLRYYKGRSEAVALRIGKVYKLSHPVGLDVLGGVKCAPQSYKYLVYSFDELCQRLGIVHPKFGLKKSK